MGVIRWLTHRCNPHDHGSAAWHGWNDGAEPTMRASLIAVVAGLVLGTIVFQIVN